MANLTDDEWKQRFKEEFIKLTECTEDDADNVIDANWPEIKDDYEDEPEEAAEIYSVDYE